MARWYDDLVSEVEEMFPRGEERLVELETAFQAIGDRLNPAGTELIPVDGQALGRVLCESVILTGDEHCPPVVLDAGTVLGPFHLGILTQAGVEEAPVRRLARVSVMVATACSDLKAAGAVLQLAGEVAGWPVEVHNLGVVAAEGEALLKAVAEGVTAHLLCIACAEPVYEPVREACRALGSRTLIPGLLCSPGSETAVMKRQDCLILMLPTKSVAALLMHRLVLGFSLATLSGIPPASAQELRVDCDLPMTERLGVLIPAVHGGTDGVGRRLGPAVRPVGDPEAPGPADILQATCVIYRPPHSLPCERGDRVRVLSLAGGRSGTPTGGSDGEETRR